MTDRELLEMAAKAIGHGVEWVKVKLDDEPEPRIIGLDSNPYWFNWPRWNPLVNDGDALRLALSLNMLVMCDIYTCTVKCRGVTCKEAYSGNEHGLNTASAAMPAVRRAIVRAAAEGVPP